MESFLQALPQMEAFINSYCGELPLTTFSIHIDENDLNFIHQVRILYKKQGYPDVSALKHYRILAAKYALLCVEPGLNKPLHHYEKEENDGKIEIYEIIGDQNILKGSFLDPKEADAWMEENKNAIHDTTSHGRKQKGLPLPIVKITKLENNKVSLAFKQATKIKNTKHEWYEVKDIDLNLTKFLIKAQNKGFDTRYKEGILKFSKWEQLLEAEKIGKGGQTINPVFDKPIPEEWLGQHKPVIKAGIKESVQPGPKTIDYNGLKNCSKHDIYKLRYYKDILWNKVPKNTEKENLLLDFVREVYTGEILNHHQGIDIYLPELKIGFDFHEMLWHTDSLLEKEYHWKKASKAEVDGIRLIQIYEDEWDNKNEIVKSRIRCILGKCNKISARKTEAKKISQKQSTEFLEKTHIQGNYNSIKSYGLFLEDQLVACMTFGISRFNKQYNSELLRYSSELNTVVVGGAGKLLNTFLKENKDANLLSYADRRWSTGNLYKTLGFQLDEISHPSHSYYNICTNELLTRQKMYKKKLVNMFGYSDDKKEHEIMLLNGFERIWDAGQYRFSLYPNMLCPEKGD